MLLALALNLHLVPAGTAQAAIAAILISMLIAPFLILYGDKITRRLIKQDWMFQALDLHHMLVESMSKNDHVVICGYGRSGQALARLLEAEEIPFFALDMDPERCARPARPAIRWCSATPASTRCWWRPV